jgi:hypothetical protein
MNTTMTKPPNVATSCAFVSFVVGVLFLLMGCGGPPKHPTWTNATGAEQYERLMWKSIRDADWKNVEYHLAPTFVGVDERGQAFNRESWVQHWKTSQIREFSLAEVSVQPEGPDMVVTYVLQLSYASSATSLSADKGLRVVSVWQQVKKGWILTATTITPVA